MNIYIFKIYKLPDETNKFIGLPAVTSNFNMIVHSMFDVVSQ
jgi:hypothetical protein